MPGEFELYSPKVQRAAPQEHPVLQFRMLAAQAAQPLSQGLFLGWGGVAGVA